VQQPSLLLNADSLLLRLFLKLDPPQFLPLLLLPQRFLSRNLLQTFSLFCRQIFLPPPFLSSFRLKSRPLSLLLLINKSLLRFLELGFGSCSFGRSFALFLNLLLPFKLGLACCCLLLLSKSSLALLFFGYSSSGLSNLLQTNLLSFSSSLLRLNSLNPVVLLFLQS
jgi:hypothetical protein